MCCRRQICLRSRAFRPKSSSSRRLRRWSWRPVLASLHKTGRLLAVEDVCAANCIGEQVLSAAEQAGIPLKAARLLNLGNGIIPHGAPDVLKAAYDLDARAIAAAAQAMRSGEKEGNGA